MFRLHNILIRIILPLLIICNCREGLYGQFGRSAATKAVIIGISDYADDAIPDLEYAHRDAEAFAHFLKHIRPGTIDADHISLLTNQNASGGQVHNAFNQLLENAKTNDQIIIYFSGHGDVESISDVEEGHLLLHDTPNNNYQINSLRVADLKKIVQQLTNDIGAHVLLIVDACRSGTLAGEIINGAEATAHALSQQFAKETKILSCQPNEKSLEGAQWGGGRGLFSYHLIEGLTGLADNNNDLQITVREIQRYLEDWVEADAEPLLQSPIVMGNKNKIVADVDEEKLLELMNYKSSDASASQQAIASIVEKGIQVGLSEVSSLIDSFYYALDQEYFIPGDQPNRPGRIKGQSASELFDKILISGIPEAQIRGAKGDFVAALQDDAQQAINAYLKSDNDEFIERHLNRGSKYVLYPKYLEKAVTLLGSRHYLYGQLIARQYYFQSVNDRIQNTSSGIILEKYEANMELIHKALLYEDRGAYLYNELGILYGLLKDSAAIEMYQKAIDLSPSWARAHCNLADVYLKKGNYKKAETKVLTGLNLDPGYSLGLGILSKIYLKTERPQKAEKLLLDFITANGPDYYIYSRIGDLYESQRNMKEARKYFELSNEVSPNYYAHYSLGYLAPEDNLDVQKFHYENALALRPFSKDVLNNLGWLYHKGYEKMDTAIAYYSRAIEVQPNFLNPNLNLAKIYFDIGDLIKAKKYFLRIVKEINQEHAEAYYYLSQLGAIEGNNDTALDYLKKAINYGFEDMEAIKKEKRFDQLRKTKKFNQILSKIKRKE